MMQWLPLVTVNLKVCSEFQQFHRATSPTLVFYACLNHTAFVEAFVRGWRRAMSPDEIAGTLNTALIFYYITYRDPSK